MGGDSDSSRISRVIFDGNIARQNGGAIDWNSTGGNLTHTIFKNNKAQYGAALCRESKSTNGFGINNTFIANHAYIAGAGLAWMNAKGIKINNYSFVDNTADEYGAAIFISEGSDNCVIFNSTFDNNYITDMTDGHYGGAVCCFADNATINMSSFNNNRANEGGAIYAGSMATQTSVLSSNFTSNKAAANGGAIALRSSGLDINESYFNGNEAVNGGAVYVGGQGESNNIYYSTFDENKAIGGDGGAVNWIAAGGKILYSNFTANTADYGGGLFIAGQASESEVSHVIFRENKAVHNGGAMESNATGVALTFTDFIENEAGDFGAALCRESGATGGHGHNVTFIKNYAGIGGAALAWMNVSNIKIINYTFINNSAGEHGGAIFVETESNNCKVLDC